MNPLQKNKVDISSLTEEEQKLFRLYGKLPNKKDLLQNKLKERKYFDSGDYAMSKAGKAGEGGVTSIGREHPQPENIPHLSSPVGNGPSNGHTPSQGSISLPGGSSGSPVKESSFLQRETSVDEPSILSPKSPETKGPTSSPPANPSTNATNKPVPIRWQS